MSLTQRNEAIALWLAQVGSAIAKRCCEAQIARRYGCRYFPDLEISEGGVIARCCNSLVASTVWQLRQPLIELGDELSVYWGWHHERLYLQGVRMSETPGGYNVGIPRPEKTSFETQLQSLPPDVRSVAESLALRDPESAKRYVALYLSGNRGKS